MKVLVSDALSAGGLRILEENLATDYRPEIDHQELRHLIGAYDALVVRSRTQVTAEIIEAGRRLKVIGRAGAGVDNIDLEKATEKGIIVINTPGANTISTAEHALAMLSSLARNIPAADKAYKEGRYNRQKLMGVELYHKTLGIIGLGRVGGEVARRAQAIGMRLLAYDPYISAERAERVGAELVDLPLLLKEADFITLHLPLVSATRHIIAARELALVKPGVRLVNCARGGLIDEEALCQAIIDGRVAGAALDVFENDNPSQNRLFTLDNVIVTPHLGASTLEAQENVSRQVADQVIKALAGEPVISAVNVPGFSPETMAEVKPYLPLMHMLGSFLVQLFGGAVEEVGIHYSGGISGKPLGPLTASCLIGMLQVILGEQVNYVNAGRIIESRGIKVRETRSSDHRGYANHVSVTVKSGKQQNTVAGAVFNGGQTRIVQIGEYLIDVLPSRYMLVTTHRDRPGVVGKVGTILGRENINIASMQVGRKDIRGEAVMVIQVDDPIPGELLRQLSRLDLLHGSWFVELKAQDLIKSG